MIKYSIQDEALIKEIDDLYKEGVFSEEEYNKKKNQILKKYGENKTTDKKRSLFTETDSSKKISKDNLDLKGRIQECTNWIETTLKIKIEKFPDSLKDGRILFSLANAIEKDMCPWSKFKDSKVPFLCLNNITEFVKGIQRFGVSKDDIFISNDLYYEKNIRSVLDTLYMFAWAAHSKGWKGPTLGNLYKKGSYFDNLKKSREEEKNRELDRRRKMSLMRREKLSEAENRKKEREAAIARKDLKELIDKTRETQNKKGTELSKLSEENGKKLKKELDSKDEWVQNSGDKEKEEIVKKKNDLSNFISNVVDDDKKKDKLAMNDLINFYNNISKRVETKNDPLSKLSPQRKNKLENSVENTNKWVRRNSRAKAYEIIPKKEELKNTIDNLIDEQEKENKLVEDSKKDFINYIDDLENKSKNSNEPLSKISKGNKEKLLNALKNSKDWIKNTPNLTVKDINDKKQDLKELVDSLFGEEADQKKKKAKNLAQRFDKSIDNINDRRKDKKDPLSKLGKNNKKKLDDGIKKANNFIVKVKDKQGKLKDFDDDNFDLDLILEEMEEEKIELDNLVDNVLKDEKDKQKQGEELVNELLDKINEIEDKKENKDDPLSQLNPSTENKLNNGLKKAKDFLTDVRVDDGRLVNTPDEEFDIDLFKNQIKKQKKDLDDIVSEVLNDKKKDDENQKKGQKLIDELLDTIKDIDEKKNNPDHPLSNLDDKDESKLDDQLDKVREFLADVIQTNGKLKNPNNDEEFDVNLLAPLVKKHKKDLDEIVDQILKDKEKKDKAQIEGEKLAKELNDLIKDVEDKKNDKNHPLGNLDKKDNDKLNDALKKPKQFLIDSRSENGKFVNPDDEEFNIDPFRDRIKKHKKDLEEIVGQILNDKDKKDDAKKFTDQLKDKIDKIEKKLNDKNDPLSQIDGPAKEKLNVPLKHSKDWLKDVTSDDGNVKFPKDEEFDIDSFKNIAKKKIKDLDQIVAEILDDKKKKDKAQNEGKKFADQLKDKIDELNKKLDDKKDPLSKVDGPAKEKLKKPLKNAKDWLDSVTSDNGKLHNPGKDDEFDVEPFKKEAKKKIKDLDQIVGEILDDKKKKR